MQILPVVFCSWKGAEQSVRFSSSLIRFCREISIPNTAVVLKKGVWVWVWGVPDLFEYQCHFLTYGTSVLNVYHGKLFVSPNGIHYCDPISIGVVSICQQTFRYLDWLWNANSRRERQWSTPKRFKRKNGTKTKTNSISKKIYWSRFGFFIIRKSGL